VGINKGFSLNFFNIPAALANISVEFSYLPNYFSNLSLLVALDFPHQVLDSRWILGGLFLTWPLIEKLSTVKILGTSLLNGYNFLRFKQHFILAGIYACLLS